MSRTWTVLSIDGGGIRGIIPAIILSAIEEKTGTPIAQLFDVIAGTSVGGILALGLTRPDENGLPYFTAARMSHFLMNNGARIFHNPSTWLQNVMMPKYNAVDIESFLKDIYDDTMLHQSLTDVLVPCYDIENRSPHIFKSRWARRQKHYNFPLRDVARATSAAPTLWDPARIFCPAKGGEISLVDGGIFANNPALYAYLEVQTMLSREDHDILVVSLGTGKGVCKLTHDKLRRWGLAEWSRPMLDLITDGLADSVHMQMSSLLPAHDHQHYYRFQADLPDRSEELLDNISAENIQHLVAAAEDLLETDECQADLNRLCQRLLEVREQRHPVSSLAPPASYSSTRAGAAVVEVASSVDLQSQCDFDGKTGKISATESCDVWICCAQADQEKVAVPLEEALLQTVSKVSVDVYPLAAEDSLRQLIAQADRDATIGILILSRDLFNNHSVSRQLPWLYARALGGRTVLIPVLHGIDSTNVDEICREHRWDMQSAITFKQLVNLAEVSIGANLQDLADQLAITIKAWSF